MGETPLDAPAWFGSLVPSAIAATLWAFLLAGSAGTSLRSRRAFHYGLAAACAGYLGTIALTSALVGIAPSAPGWIILLIIAPLVEETARLTSAGEASLEPPSWLAFGFGYGLFEARLKAADLLVLLVGEGTRPWDYLALGSATVPLLLHLFLSVGVLASLRLRTPRLAIFAGAMVVHGLHNLSVLAFPPDGLRTLVLMNLLRDAIFLVLIVLILSAFKRPAAAAANTAG